jgi:hypothetical protein
MAQISDKRASILLAGIILISALLPRLCAIDRYITPDELTWVYRSVRFREALVNGRWGETLITGHPAGRLIMALTTSLGIVAIYALARRLFGRRVAILAAFMLALDPFTAGLSGLLHLDGLAATLTPSWPERALTWSSSGKRGSSCRPA